MKPLFVILNAVQQKEIAEANIIESKKLEYRSLRFETEVLDEENYQGNAVVNYTKYEIPYTRVIEHKHFEFDCQNGNYNPKTVITRDTREYPATWQKGDEPYYPMNDEKNNMLFAKYKEYEFFVVKIVSLVYNKRKAI